MLAFDDPLPRRPRRVAIAGVSGAGKTTLAARIAEIIEAPHTEIDGLFHGAGWTERPEFLDDVKRLVAGESWVTEWQYAPARPLITARADLLIWLDLPYWRCVLPCVVRRTLRRRLRRQELWNGNIEPALHTFFTDREHIVRWSLSTRRKYDERIPHLAEQDVSPTVVRLRSQSEVDRWLTGPLRSSARVP